MLGYPAERLNRGIAIIRKNCLFAGNEAGGQRLAILKESTKLKREITKLKKQLSELGDMRPGSLTRQSRSWDKEYWQISYTHRGRGRTGYVSDANYERVKAETENYKKFKELCSVLIDKSIEYAKLKDKETDS